jgi:hypothetical protein
MAPVTVPASQAAKVFAGVVWGDTGGTPRGTAQGVVCRLSRPALVSGRDSRRATRQITLFSRRASPPAKKLFPYRPRWDGSQCHGRLMGLQRIEVLGDQGFLLFGQLAE